MFSSLATAIAIALANRHSCLYDDFLSFFEDFFDIFHNRTKCIFDIKISISKSICCCLSDYSCNLCDYCNSAQNYYTRRITCR